MSFFQRLLNFPSEWKNHKCLFTITTGRTGTMTIIKLFNASPQASAFHEPSPIMGEVNKEAYSSLQKRREYFEQAFVDARKRKITQAYLLNKTYVEHSVMIAMMPLIAEILPNTKFLHIFRHPGAIVRSGMRRGWFAGHPWDKYRAQPQPGDPVLLAWENQWGAFEKTCWVWKTMNDIGIQLREKLGPERVMPLAFQDLVADGGQGYLKIFDFIGLPPPATAKAQKIMAEQHNRQLKKSFPKYEEWSVSQKKTLFRIAGDTMKKLNYEMEI